MMRSRVFCSSFFSLSTLSSLFQLIRDQGFDCDHNGRWEVDEWIALVCLIVNPLATAYWNYHLYKDLRIRFEKSRYEKQSQAMYELQNRFDNLGSNEKDLSL